MLVPDASDVHSTARSAHYWEIRWERPTMETAQPIPTAVETILLEREGPITGMEFAKGGQPQPGKCRGYSTAKWVN